uniref:Putative product n=1 Tax=Xenopsylla cheopis TaxID=163159 RepID=A0A6M2DX21_XENCH
MQSYIPPTLLFIAFTSAIHARFAGPSTRSQGFYNEGQHSIYQAPPSPGQILSRAMQSYIPPGLMSFNPIYPYTPPEPQQHPMARRGPTGPTTRPYIGRTPQGQQNHRPISNSQAVPFFANPMLNYGHAPISNLRGRPGADTGPFFSKHIINYGHGPIFKLQGRPGANALGEDREGRKSLRLDNVRGRGKDDSDADSTFYNDHIYVAYNYRRQFPPRGHDWFAFDDDDLILQYENNHEGIDDEAKRVDAEAKWAKDNPDKVKELMQQKLSRPPKIGTK